MIATVTSLDGALRSDFDLACVDLAEARRRQVAEDTPAHRGAVVEARARIDALLDMYLAALMSAAGLASPAAA